MATPPRFAVFSLIGGLLPWGHMNQRRARSSPARLPNRLWQYRKRMGFTQNEVPAMLGYLSRAEISDFERGDKLPSFVSALKLELVSLSLSLAPSSGTR